MRLKEYPFIQKVGWIFSGLFAAQLINLLFAFLLPRIYAPEQFATFGIFLATVAILFEVNNFKLDQALMLPKEDHESVFIFRKAVTYSSLVSAGLSFVWLFYILGPWSNRSYFYLGWIPISLFLNGIIQPTISYLNRIQAYKLLNTGKIIQAVTVGMVSCLPFMIETNKIFLIAGFVSGQLLCVAIFSKIIYRNFRKVSKNKAFSLRPYSQFPKYGTWSSLVNTISRNAIVYVLSIFFGPGAVGLYTFANRLARTPIELISSSVGLAYFRDASHSKNSGELLRLTKNTQKFLVRIAVVPVIVALLWGPEIFRFLFGSEWFEAGRIVRYLALWYGVGLVVTPLSSLLDVKGKLKWELGYTSFFGLTRTAFLILGGLFFTLEWTLIGFCLISVLFSLYLFNYLRKLVTDES